jgi:hypothetical protein
MATETLCIQTPKDGQKLRPQNEFLCLGFADGVDPAVLQKNGYLAAHIATPDRQLHVCGVRIPDDNLPDPPTGQPPYAWGFLFPVLPDVFHDDECVLFVRLIEDDGTTTDAEPHTVLWDEPRFLDVTIQIDDAMTPSGSRIFSADGKQSPPDGSVSAWVSNTKEVTTQWGSKEAATLPETWQRHFSIPVSWGNKSGSATTLYAQCTDSSGSSQIASVGIMLPPPPM